jgi:hypothetical protein
MLGALLSPFSTTRRIGFLANSPSNLADVFSRANALQLDLVVHVGDFEPSLDIQSIIGSIETFSFVPVLVAAGDRDVAQFSSWYSLAQGLATVYQNGNLGNLELFCTGNVNTATFALTAFTVCVCARVCICAAPAHSRIHAALALSLTRLQVGLATTCLWNGVGFVVSSIGLDICPSPFALSYIQSKLDELDANHAQFKFCVFHRGNSLMNIDDDPNNYTSISVYDTCRQAGAVVITGNSRQSAITRVMSSFATRTIAANQTITNGQSVSAVVGLGGQAAVPADALKASQTMWSYTKDTGAEILVATINSTQVSFSYQSLVSVTYTVGEIPPAFTYAYTH